MKNSIVLLASIFALNAFGMREPTPTALWVSKMATASARPVELSPSISLRSSSSRATAVPNKPITTDKPAQAPIKVASQELAADPNGIDGEEEGHDGCVRVFASGFGLPVGTDGDDYQVETIQDPRTGREKKVYYPKNVHQTPHEPSDTTSSDSSSGKQSRSGAVSPAPQTQQQTLQAIQESPQRQAASARTVAVQPMPVPMPAPVQTTQSAAAPVRHVTLSDKPPVVHRFIPEPKHTEQTELLAKCCVIL